jgi:hypothetical protein
MKLYSGIDLHSSNSNLAIIDENGGLVNKSTTSPWLPVFSLPGGMLRKSRVPRAPNKRG